MRADNVSRASRRRIPSRDGEGVSTHGKNPPRSHGFEKSAASHCLRPLGLRQKCRMRHTRFFGAFCGGFRDKERERRKWRRNRAERTPSDRGFEKSAVAQPQGALGVREKCRMRHNRFFEGCRRTVPSGRRKGLFVVSGQAEGRPGRSLNLKRGVPLLVRTERRNGTCGSETSLLSWMEFVRSSFEGSQSRFR